MLKIYLKKNNYYIFWNNKLFFSQKIIKSKFIPKYLSPITFWYFYILIICVKFGLISMLTVNNILWLSLKNILIK